MKKLIVWGIPAILLLVLVGWRFSVRSQTEAAAGGGGRPGGAGSASGGPGGPGGGGGGAGGRGGPSAVQVASAERRAISASIESVGNLESPYRVQISPKTTGRIEYLEAREGDAVTPGQVLVRIDPSELQAAVYQQQANVAEARSRLAQARLTQGSTNVGISSQIQQQRAGLSSAQAELNQVRRSFDAQLDAAKAQVNAAEAAVSNAQAELKRQQASLQNAQVRYDRTNNLYRQGFIAAQDVDDAKTALEVQRSAVDVATGALEAARQQANVQKQNLTIVARKGEADIAASRAKVTQAQASVNVATANRAQSPAYAQNIAALESSVRAAEAQLGQAHARLNDTVLRSTIRGTVTRRTADPGSLASPGTPVLEVQFLDWFYVTTSLPVEQAGSIREGQTARVTFDALAGRTFTGNITHVNLAADPQSRQFSIRVKLHNADGKLRSGMYAKVAIETRRIEDATVVPREALKRTPEGAMTVVVVDAESVAHVRTVQTGASDERGTQILEGVEPGERVVILTYANLRDGQKVNLGGAGRSGGGRGSGEGGRPGGSGRTEGQGRRGGNGG